MTGVFTVQSQISSRCSLRLRFIVQGHMLKGHVCKIYEFIKMFTSFLKLNLLQFNTRMVNYWSQYNKSELLLLSLIYQCWKNYKKLLSIAMAAPYMWYIQDEKGWVMLPQNHFDCVCSSASRISVCLAISWKLQIACSFFYFFRDVRMKCLICRVVNPYRDCYRRIWSHRLVLWVH